MREEFVRIFEGLETLDRESREFSWLVQLIDETARDTLGQSSLQLRSDAFLFLFHNLRLMVIIPWLLAHGTRSEFFELETLIREDLRLIFEHCVQARDDKIHAEVSANTVITVIVALGVHLRTRAAEFWGP